MGRPLVSLAIHLCLGLGVESVDHLPHKRLAQPDTAVDLLRQHSEALVAKPDRLLLPLLRNRRRHRQLVPSVQRDCFGYCTHVMLETIEPRVHIIKTLAHQSLHRGGGLKKPLKGGFHEHALADAWLVCCDVKPITDTLAQPNRHLATRGAFALGRGSEVNAALRIQFSEFLHLTFPNAP
jgi:hypothetical protein